MPPQKDAKMRSCPIDDQCKPFTDSAGALRHHIRRNHIELLTCHCGTVLTTREKLAEHQTACPSNQPTATNHESLPSPSRMAQSRCDDCHQYKTQLAELTEENKKLLQANQEMARQIEFLHQQLMGQSNANRMAVDDNVVNQVSQSSLTTTVPTSFSALPNELLVLIFSYLSQRDVCQVVRVCRQWNLQQPNVLSKVHSISLMVCPRVPYDDDYQFNNKHMSKLVSDDGSTIHAKYRFDQQCFKLHHRSLHTQIVEELTEQFPAIVTLRITINERSYNVLDYVMKLIRKWSTKLTTLELWCSFTEQDCSALSNKVLELFKVINSLPVLKHLTVEIRHCLYRNTGGAVRLVDGQFQSMDVELRFEMPILARLQEFNFGVRESICDTPLYHLLSQHVQTDQFIRIGLSTVDSADTCQTFAILCPAVALRIKFLPTTVFSLFSEQSPLLQHFPSLTEVTICINKIRYSFDKNFCQIVNMLSPLRQLVHLKLNFDASPCTPGQNNIPLSRIDQLKSVKMLTLTKYIQQKSVEWSHWAWALPNVQIIEMSPSNALRYVPDKSYCKTVLNCPKLRRVFFLEYDENVEDTREAWTEWMVVETLTEMRAMTLRKVSKSSSGLVSGGQAN